MGQSDDGMVVFAGGRLRPELVGDAVEVELMVEALERGAAHHAENGGEAACGCPLRLNDTEPYLHREGCRRHGELQVERWLREVGGCDAT